MVGDARGVVLAELVDVAGEGPVDLGPVTAAAGRGDVLVVTLTDEEVHWLGRGEAAPKAYLDAPRLARLGEDEQRVALETAAWMMTARGEFAWNGGAPRVHGLPAVVGAIRGRTPAVAIARVQRRGGDGSLSAAYEAGRDLLLCEDVSEAGLHRFVFRSPRLAAAALAAQVDPEGRATVTAPPQIGRDTAELDPHPDDLAKTCEASSLLYHAALTRPDRIAARALTVYSGPQGVWALAGLQPDGDTPGRVAWQQFDGGALLDLLDAFLQRATGDAGHD